MAEEHGGTTNGTEDERIAWMVQQHAGAETTVESSMGEVWRRELRQLFRVRLETCRS